MYQLNLLCFANILGILRYISLKGPFSIRLSLGMQSPSVSFKNTYIHIDQQNFQYSLSDHQLRKENNWYVYQKSRHKSPNRKVEKSIFSRAPKYNFSVEKRKNYPLCKTLLTPLVREAFCIGRYLIFGQWICNCTFHGM